MVATQSQLRDPALHTGGGEGRGSDEIKRDIDRTRAEMDQTIDQLGDRLNPRHLFDDVLELFRSDGSERQYSETARRVGKRMIRQVKRHPVPAMLFGAGLAWLMLEDDEAEGHVRRREPRMHSGSYVDARTGEPYDESYGDEWNDYRFDDEGEFESQSDSGGWVEGAKGSLGAAQEKVAGAGHSVADSVTHAASRVSGAASGAASRISGAASGAAARTGEWAGRTRRSSAAAGRRVRSGARRYADRAGHQLETGYAYSRDRFENAVEECPLAVGVGFLALGALLGLAMPRTRCEDEFMGEQSDHLKHRAKDVGQDVVERGKHVAEATMQTVKEDVDQEGLTPGSLGQKLQHVAAEALHAAEEAAHEEGIAPSDLAEKARHVAKHAQETAKTEAKHETETIGEQRSV